MLRDEAQPVAGDHARNAIRACLSDSAGLASATATEANMSKTSKRAATTRIAVGAQPIKTAPKPAASQQRSKCDQVLALLRRKQGASLEEMQKATGWQPHSVRGFLSATVRKRLGLKLQSSKTKSAERRYVIAV